VYVELRTARILMKILFKRKCYWNLYCLVKDITFSRRSKRTWRAYGNARTNKVNVRIGSKAQEGICHILCSNFRRSVQHWRSVGVCYVVLRICSIKMLTNRDIDYETLFVAQDRQSGVYLLLCVNNMTNTALEVCLSSSIQAHLSNSYEHRQHATS
jgi:hypothetical protein